jgi:signal transduction histidine kinase
MQSIFEASGETKYAAMMEKIDKQVNKLTYLISDLLDVTKINSGRLQFNTSTFNFDEVVEEVAQDIQTISPRHRLFLDLKFNGKLTADKDRLMQVIINLINNAIKYSPDAAEVKISTERSDHNVILRVEDYGIGIAEEKQAMIFEQFYRVSGNKEHTFPGLGLGLYISSNTITRMGGRIWVNSIEGKGSTFCFSLPLKD